MQTFFRICFKVLVAPCALFMSAFAAPALAANFDGAWNVQLRCTPWGQRSNTWVLAKTVAVKNNRGDYSIAGEKFSAKGSLLFRDGQVTIDHVATKSDDPLTFWAVKAGAKAIDVDRFQLSAIANGAGHDAGEAQCLVIGTRQSGR